MTTIAYRDGILACDSLINAGGTVLAHRSKIHPNKHGVHIGIAGDADTRAFIALFAGVRTPADMPSRQALAQTMQDNLALVVFPNGTLFRVGNNPDSGTKDEGYADIITHPYFAVGSGGEFALGAMGAGFSAKKAIEVAMQLDVYTGGPIHEYRVKKSKKSRS